ncbi:hypothetical protein C7W88_18065 (plasmid) [Novosphingobium sp. THN1]|nr:hypothetical protein C7W88_18065 [Novosphingobium sp. THN1]
MQVMTDHESLASILLQAQREGRAVPQDVFGKDLDIADALAIQRELHAQAITAGRMPCGHKIGLTSPGAMRLFGAQEPMIGTIFADTVLPPELPWQRARSSPPGSRVRSCWKSAMHRNGMPVTISFWPR